MSTRWGLKYPFRPWPVRHSNRTSTCRSHPGRRLACSDSSLFPSCGCPTCFGRVQYRLGGNPAAPRRRPWWVDRDCVVARSNLLGVDTQHCPSGQFSHGSRQWREKAWLQAEVCRPLTHGLRFQRRGIPRCWNQVAVSCAVPNAGSAVQA